MNQTSPGSNPVLPFTSCEAVTLHKRNDDIGYITEARLCMPQHGMVLLASRKEELGHICKSPAAGSVTSLGRKDSITR